MEKKNIHSNKTIFLIFYDRRCLFFVCEIGIKFGGNRQYKRDDLLLMTSLPWKRTVNGLIQKKSMFTKREV